MYIHQETGVHTIGIDDIDVVTLENTGNSLVIDELVNVVEVRVL